MKNIFGAIVSVFVAASLCACTDYAQKIEDEYGPVKEEAKKYLIHLKTKLIIDLFG